MSTDIVRFSGWLQHTLFSAARIFFMILEFENHFSPRLLFRRFLRLKEPDEMEKNKQGRSDKGPWYRDGLRFRCERCGACCIEEGPYVCVYVSDLDVTRLSHFFNLSPETFLRRFCEKEGGETILKSHKGMCVFLKRNLCRAYPMRPFQCRTWPFWTANLKQAFWKGPLRERCPGIGQGPFYSEEEIEQIRLGMSEV